MIVLKILVLCIIAVILAAVITLFAWLLEQLTFAMSDDIEEPNNNEFDVKTPVQTIHRVPDIDTNEDHYISDKEMYGG